MAEEKIIFDVRQISDVYSILSKASNIISGNHKIEEIKLIISEFISNIIRHANDGKIIISKNNEHISIMSMDTGNGLDDISKIIKSSGYGIKSIINLSDYFRLCSIPYKNYFESRICDKKKITTYKISGEEKAFLEVINLEKLSISASINSKRNFKLGGDGYIIDVNNIVTIILIDSLGHGEEAYNCTKSGIDALLKYNINSLSFEEIFLRLDKEFKNKRGAAVGILRIDNNCATYAGVGNITCKIYNDTIKNFVNVDGIVGYTSYSIYKEDINLTPNSMIKLSSDGIESAWYKNKGYNGFVETINGISEYSRGYDDSTCITLMFNSNL